MKCEICGYVARHNFKQCRQCGTLISKRTFLERLNIFRRLDEIELKQKKQSAVIMKLYAMINEKNKSPLSGEDFGDPDEAIDKFI